MIEIQAESIACCFEEIEQIAQGNYAEAGFYDYFGSMKIDKEKYQALEHVGNLVFFSFRKNNKLVGYSFYMLIPSMLSHAVIADNGAFYLVPEERKGLTACRLLKECEMFLREKGATVVIHRTRIEKDLSPIFMRAGFELTEKVFAKRIL